jgi:hypothetical protein
LVSHLSSPPFSSSPPYLCLSFFLLLAITNYLCPCSSTTCPCLQKHNQHQWQASILHSSTKIVVLFLSPSIILCYLCYLCVLFMLSRTRGFFIVNVLYKSRQARRHLNFGPLAYQKQNILNFRPVLISTHFHFSLCFNRTQFHSSCNSSEQFLL